MKAYCFLKLSLWNLVHHQRHQYFFVLLILRTQRTEEVRTLNTFVRMYAGVGKSRLIVHKENNPIINDNTRMNSVLCTQNCKPTFADPPAPARVCAGHLRHRGE